MKKFILVIIFLLTAMTISAQEVDTLTAQNQDSLNNQNIENPIATRPLNIISLSYLLSGWQYSLNYERIIYNSSNFILITGIALGYSSYTYEEEDSFIQNAHDWIPFSYKYFIIPHFITGNIGKERVFIEIGYEGIFFTANKPNMYLGAALAGIRVLPLESYNIDFRIFVLYELFRTTKPKISPEYLGLGLSLGISF